MPDSFVFPESNYFDDIGNLILTYYVDLRDPADRTPIQTLIRGCETRYAIEHRKRARISKPILFRKHGESLIKDPEEAYLHEGTLVYDRTEDPHASTEAQSLGDEFVRSSQLSQTPLRVAARTKGHIRVSHENSRMLEFGKNGWVLCASIKPSTQAEREAWRQSMPDGYDHVSYIHRRRAFARALASMVAEQVGPRGTQAGLKTTVDGEERVRTVNRVQIVYHGPVTYVANPYEFVTNAPRGFEAIMRSIFVKGVERRDQREYRFAVWADNEPPEEFVDLEASSVLLEALEPSGDASNQFVVPTGAAPDGSQDSKSDPTEPGIVPIARQSETESDSVPAPPTYPPNPVVTRNAPIHYVPRPYSTAGLPHDARRIVTTHAALEALHSVVQGWPPGDISVDAASAGWYADQCIRGLCSNFEDPIEEIDKSEDHFVIITLKFPSDRKTKGTIVIGPQGTGTLALERGLNSNNTQTESGWLLGYIVADELQDAGLHRRLEDPDPAPEVSAADS